MLLSIIKILSLQSFYDVEQWYEEVCNYAPDDCLKFIIGNKNDLEEEKLVTENMVENLIRKIKVEHIYVSAKTGLSVEQVLC